MYERNYACARCLGLPRRKIEGRGLLGVGGLYTVILRDAAGNQANTREGCISLTHAGEQERRSLQRKKRRHDLTRKTQAYLRTFDNLFPLSGIPVRTCSPGKRLSNNLSPSKTCCCISCRVRAHKTGKCNSIIRALTTGQRRCSHAQLSSMQKKRKGKTK